MALLSLRISTSPRPDSNSGTWFQNLHGCLGNEEGQGEGESHVLGSDPVPDHVQQVQYLKSRKKGGVGGRICRTAGSSLVSRSRLHGFAGWPASHIQGLTLPPPQPQGTASEALGVLGDSCCNLSSDQEPVDRNENRSALHDARGVLVRGDLSLPPRAEGPR